jgi:RND family efflux transporter MFP subunit
MTKVPGLLYFVLVVYCEPWQLSLCRDCLWRIVEPGCLGVHTSRDQHVPQYALDAIPRTRSGISIPLAWLFAFLSSSLAQAQFGPALVSVAPITEHPNVAAGHTFVGTVNPARRSVVGSAVAGRVIDFMVNDGDRVKQKQPLAQLLTKALDIQIAAARADLDLRTEEYREMVNGSREEEVREAEAQMEAAKALHEYTQKKLARTKSLIDRNASSQDQLQDDTSVALAATHRYTAAKATFEMVKTGPRKEKIAQARARMAAAEEEVNRLLDQLEKHTITAPFDGYIVREYTEVGQWISSGDPVAEVVELAEVDIDVQVLETFLPKLLVGTPARVEIGALPNELFEGKVTQIVPQADVRSRNFPVKVRLKNRFLPDGQPLLRAGMFARVILPVDQKTSVLMVPKDALVLGGPEPLVFLAVPDAKDPKKVVAQPVPVKAGIATDGLIEIIGPGLKPGLQVVVEGNERLIPGAELRVAAQAAKRSGEAASEPAGKAK